MRIGIPPRSSGCPFWLRETRYLKGLCGPVEHGSATQPGPGIETEAYEAPDRGDDQGQRLTGQHRVDG